jgi:prostaglandin reductase 1
MKGQRWILAKTYEGLPKADNFKLDEFDLPEELNDNEVLLKALYLTVDPYMRIFGFEVGKVMPGEQVAQVIKSNNKDFPIGTVVLSNAGWTTHSVSNGQGLRIIPFDTVSLALGTLGMPGATAFIGLNQCFPKKGETVLVSSSASAVGNVVGQLAKIKGCTVIGTTGSQEKVEWCKDLGFDHVINYKTENWSEALSRVAPQGIDVYFDNTGGDYFTTVINKHMNKFGRVLVCGSISTYNDEKPRLCNFIYKY